MFLSETIEQQLIKRLRMSHYEREIVKTVVPLDHSSGRLRSKGMTSLSEEPGFLYNMCVFQY